MFQRYKALLSLVCCLLLTTALALPAMAQENQAAPQTNTEDKNLNQQPSQENQDADREKATDPATQEDRSTEAEDSDDDDALPDTAGGLPILALIGSASLIGAAIRRWL